MSVAPLKDEAPVKDRSRAHPLACCVEPLQYSQQCLPVQLPDTVSRMSVSQVLASSHAQKTASSEWHRRGNQWQRTWLTQKTSSCIAAGPELRPFSFHVKRGFKLRGISLHVLLICCRCSVLQTEKHDESTVMRRCVRRRVVRWCRWCRIPAKPTSQSASGF